MEDSDDMAAGEERPPPVESIGVVGAGADADQAEDEDFLLKIVAKRARGRDSLLEDAVAINSAADKGEDAEDLVRKIVAKRARGRDSSLEEAVVINSAADNGDDAEDFVMKTVAKRAGGRDYWWETDVAKTAVERGKTKEDIAREAKQPEMAPSASDGMTASSTKAFGSHDDMKAAPAPPSLARAQAFPAAEEARPGAIRVRGPSFRDGFAAGIEDASTDDSGSKDDDEEEDDDDTMSLPGFLVDEEYRLDNIETGEPQESVLQGEAVPDKPKHFESAALMGILLLLVVIVFMGLGLGGVFGITDNMTSITDIPEVPQGGDIGTGTTSSPTLERIKERGFLKCAYTNVNRLEKALCEIMAAAILGNQTLTENVPLKIGGDRFLGIRDQRADIAIRVVSHSMERNVLEPTTLSSFTFSKPYLYTGAAVAGQPFYVNCSEDDLNHLGDCQGLRVCVPFEGTVYKSFSKSLPQRNLFFWPNGAVLELISALNNGTCNTIGMRKLLMDLPTARYFGLEGDFIYGKRYYTKDPLSIVTASEDTFFSSMVNAVFDSLLAAEQHNISKAMVASSEMTLRMKTNLFGEEYQDIFINALKAHGNYGELFNERFSTDYFPREANELNDGSTGLIYSHPFGFLSTKGREGKPLDDNIRNILDRGVLRCAIRPNRNGFALNNDKDGSSWAGMDVDYCKALAAAVFRGDQEAVEFVAIESQEAGFQLLVDGKVDVVAGATRTFQNGVREPTTGHAFDFSQPYFYSEEEDNLGLATLQTAQKDWSFLVWWVVSASFYAEEQGITSLTSNQMPEVFLYGEEHKRIFRDTVLAVGSHADIYERNLEPIIPRSGRNLLNSMDNIGAQQYALPGFLEVLNFEG